MFNDLIHWLSSRNSSELLLLFLGLLVLDGPRYSLSRLALCVWEMAVELWDWFTGRRRQPTFDHCPSVAAVLAGYNEADTIGGSLNSIVDTYPDLEIVVVDDGSQDGMADVAREIARQHENILVLSRSKRSGKSSALNFALPYTSAEILVNVDCDSHLSPDAIREVVQPFRDPRVGAVSGTIWARNGFRNLVTWLQAYEYLQCIFIGRILSSHLRILSIVSGAFAAMRRDVVERLGGWDVGPAEDLDLTLRIRKAGYQVVSAPYAACHTDVPSTWIGFWKQRLRWEEGAVIRNHTRKHVDMADLRSRNARPGNVLLVLEAWLFSVFCAYAAVAYMIWMCTLWPAHITYLLLSFYVCAVVLECLQVISVFLFSTEPRQHLAICLAAPVAPFYHLLLLLVRVVATSRELLLRSSFDDNFVPSHVRQATWRW